MEIGKFIEIIRQHSIIYDTSSRLYKDHNKRAAVWQEIGKIMKQPPEKCKEDWNKLRNRYINALKRRRKKKDGQVDANIEPWKYEKQMSFLQPHVKSRPLIISNVKSTPESPEFIEYVYSPPPVLEYQNSQPESRATTPCSSHSAPSCKPLRNRKDIQDLYDLIKSMYDLKQQNMDETDLFFLSMSKTVKSLPKRDQTKIKLDLHTAVSQAEIRKLETQEKISSQLQPCIEPATSILPECDSALKMDHSY